MIKKKTETAHATNIDKDDITTHATVIKNTVRALSKEINIH